MRLIIFLLLIGLNIWRICGTMMTKNDKGRHSKFLGLFNVIQFSNTVCNSSNSIGNEQGICYTKSECSAFGGKETSECAMGFGVCCVFDYNCSGGSMGNQEVFYLRSKDYPTENTDPSVCVFSIEIKDQKVCQIRLDFEDFQMDGGSEINKPCDRDYMEVFSSTGAGGLGMGRLCGKNDGQHLYIPIHSVFDSPMIRIMTDNREEGLVQGYRWSIKVTQIDCTSNEPIFKNLRAPQGCLQYFRGDSGTISSFNWNPNVPSQYVTDQHYAICIERRTTDCELRLRRSKDAPPYSTWIGTDENSNSDKCSNENGCSMTKCIKFSTNSRDEDKNDWLEISSFFADQSTVSKKEDVEYIMNNIYCGVGLGPDSNNDDGMDDGIPIISQTKGPFVIVFHADPNPGTEIKNTRKDELGFSVEFSLHTSCQTLKLTNP